MNILITGGASGLGLAITKRLQENKEDQIYFTFAKSELSASLIEKSYGNTKKWRCDFTEDASLESLIIKMKEWDIDILINNALPSYINNHFHKIPHSSFTESFTTNIIPVIRITQESIKIMRKKKIGKIINILSSAILNTPPLGRSIYTANKNYLLSLSKSWATENGRFNISSNCISPAFMETKLNEKIHSSVVTKLLESHPLKKLLTVEEVADVVHFYTKVSNQVSGTNLPINCAENI